MRARLSFGLRFPTLFVRAIWSARDAKRMRTPGLEWAAFGRRLGWDLIRRGDTHGLSMLLTPVNIVRYWEFPFAKSCLPSNPRRCLDVASPRLFSLFVAKTHEGAEIAMINPDTRDAALTRRIIARLGIAGIDVSERSIGDLQAAVPQFDCVWALSVVEHIAGEDGDTEGVRTMYRALAPGGRLIITVPVDREFRIEYRDRDEYGLGGDVTAPAERYFFQRYYDEETIARRLIGSVGQPAVVVRWFGERQSGRFLAYERSWQRLGHRRTVDDPIEIGRHYKEFATWSEMPGVGVCGFTIEKPMETHDD